MRWRARGVLLAVICAASWDAAAAEYVDREIDPKNLVSEQQTPSWLALGVDPYGWPRSVSLTARYQSSSIDGAPATNAYWSVLHASLDTPNHGALTLDAAYSPNTNALLGVPTSHGSWTLSQRRVPFGDGWFANNGVGIVQAGSLDLPAQQYRFGVASRLLLGATTTWLNEVNGWGLMASSGSLVALDAVGQTGYADLGGRATSMGVQWRPKTSPWSYALQATDYRPADATTALAPGMSGQGVLQVLRHETTDTFWQINLLGTHALGSAEGWRTGGWLDASMQDGAIEHRLGLNSLRADQEWLGEPVAAGATGGYYRVRYRTRQTLLEAQIDDQSYTGVGGATGSHFAQVWSNARYQLDQATGVGIQASAARTGDAQSGNVLAYREIALPEGGWRALAGWNAAAGQRDQWQIGGDLSRNWFDIQFNAALSIFFNGGSKLGTDTSVSATRELGERISFVIGLRRYNAIEETSAGTSVSASLQYRLAAGWSLGAALSESRGASQLRAIGPTNGAPVAPGLVSYVPQQRFAWLSLRYDFGAGTADVPLGARLGAKPLGGGRIEGVVYLDTNGNGRLDPGEAMASGVTVVLDGLYTVRTDAQGHYDFGFVVSGEHRLQVLPDNIPLPWSLGEQAGQSVSLSPRGREVINFGATRN